MRMTLSNRDLKLTLGVSVRHFYVIYYLTGLLIGTRDKKINTMSPNHLTLPPLLKVFILTVKAVASIHWIDCQAKGSRQRCFHST